MTVYTIRPANRSEAKPLIGFYSESDGGKTKSALLLARGFVGPAGKVVMIETEGGRGEAYVDQIPGGYEVISIRETFSPSEYGEALTAAEQAKAAALIIDSASHEWEGAGGVLDMAAKNQAEGKKGVLVWQRPKIEHQKHFMLRLLQTPIPLVIICMRAKYPMIEVPKQGGGKEWVRGKDLEPKQSEDILFELFAHGWFDKAEHKLHITGCKRDDLRAVLGDGQRITTETGRALAEWAKGMCAPNAGASEPASAGPQQQPAPGSPPLTGDAAAPTDIAARYRKKIDEAPRDRIAAIVEDAKSDPDLFPPDCDAVIAHARKRYSDLGARP